MKVLHSLAPQWFGNIYFERVDLKGVFLLSSTAKRPYRGGLDRFYVWMLKVSICFWGKHGFRQQRKAVQQTL